MDLTTRMNILNCLISFNRPMNEIKDLMRFMPWDQEDDDDEPYVILTRNHIIDALQRFLAAQLTAEDIQDWAFRIDKRPDIGYEEGYEPLLIELIEKLDIQADMGSPITDEIARQYIFNLATIP